MNLILLTRNELEQGLAADDERVVHVRDVLKCGAEDVFDIGVVNGPRGKARMSISNHGLAVFDYTLGSDPAPLFPITLIMGMPRPQTARRLLREMTSIGVARLWFAITDRSDTGYASSKLWTTGEYERHVRQGAEQAFCTRLPEIRQFSSLSEAVEAIEAIEATGAGMARFALDNYEAELAMSGMSTTEPESVLAIGAERGWSANERDHLRAARFTIVHLGDRVLRVETAAIAATTILLSRLGVV